MTRKIDKRACRKFAMPELEFNLNEGVLHVENCPYIIRTAVRNISGQRILVLYIYQSENILAGSLKPRWVMFHSRDDFATLSFREDAKATWQCSTLDSLDRIGSFDSKCAFYRQQDEARVARFCKCERGAISMLGYAKLTGGTTPGNPDKKPGGSTTPDKKPVKSGNTGDAGITLYLGMALVAVLAGAVIVTRKRKEN